MAKPEEKQPRAHRVPVSTVVLAVAAVALAVIAIVGWTSYEGERVPEGAAAKVNDTYIEESAVADSINQYRIGYNLTDDGAFANALLQQNLNVASFRQNIINQKALALLIDEKAQELNVVPSDEDVQAKVDDMKKNLAFNDDSTWSKTLDQYGMTEQDVFDQQKANLEQQAVLEQQVDRRTPDDAYTLSYAQQNLAGVTQKHAYRIVLTGDDAPSRANECSSQIEQAAAAGTLTTDYFSQLARTYSNADDVSETGGSFAWSVQVTDDELSELLESLDVGEASAPNSISSDNATEILYCDASYTFPDSSSISNLKQEDVPESLWDVVKQKAGDALWQSDCSSYLAWLLAQAKITYYPVPDDAAYNVDMTNATASASDDSGSGASDGAASNSAGGSASS